MIGAIMSVLARAGLAERFLRPAAGLVAILAAIALLWGLKSIGGIWLAWHDKGVREAYRAELRADAAARQAAAEAIAAGTRVKDAVANRDQQEAYDNAINNPKPGDPAGAHVRLNCERLRRGGRSLAELPECSGR